MNDFEKRRLSGKKYHNDLVLIMKMELTHD